MPTLQLTVESCVGNRCDSEQFVQDVCQRRRGISGTVTGGSYEYINKVLKQCLNPLFCCSFHSSNHLWSLKNQNNLLDTLASLTVGGYWTLCWWEDEGQEENEKTEFCWWHGFTTHAHFLPYGCLCPNNSTTVHHPVTLTGSQGVDEV